MTAAIAMALIDARRPAEARRWCDEALVAARGAGSADEEADVLITLGVIEQYDDPAKACSLFAAARAQAAGAGNPEIELRACTTWPRCRTSSGTWRPRVPPATRAPRWPSGPASAGPRSRSSRAARSSRPTTGPVTGTSASGCWRPFPS